MANIQTRYLGLELKNPLIASSGPLTRQPGSVAMLEDAGIAAVVLRSIFEEQITAETSSMYADLENETSAFALEYLRADLPGQIGPEAYLRRLEAIRKRVKIPVIASCNCLTKAKWIAYARKIAQTGADALELNLYHMPVDPDETSEQIEARNVELVKAVIREVKIPVSVKLSYHYTSLPAYTRKLDQAGVKGIVLFNRFLQTDVDIDKERIFYAPNYSSPKVLHGQLRWTAVLRDNIHADIGISGGIHAGDDLIKALLVGANVGMICSVLHLHPDASRTIGQILNRLQEWMTAKGYPDLAAFRGKLREIDLHDGKGFERAQYVKAATELFT
ncbi:MAG: dihydroorotate dehydrogenase-like protein [Kiritimatiellae bacterium]|nr:dihydroorotate dehydrogenase-like protein [Kiritimatiellia bacterium]